MKLRPYQKSVTTAHKLSCLLLIPLVAEGCSGFSKNLNGSSGNVVEIVGQKGSWSTLVNGKTIVLKGVGVGYESDKAGTDYLELAREMGANTVRTWGTRQGTKKYLNRAHKKGLYVNAGIWFNQAFPDGECSYLVDNDCTRKAREDALKYIEKNKNHPAILFWNIGNETIHWTKNEKERIAFSHFLEELIKEVKTIDPHHPVIYTSAYTDAVPYAKKYIPSLDIFGINVYGGLDEAHKKIIAELDIPYIVNEFGPLGPWDRPNDINGKPEDSPDVDKAIYYDRYIKEIDERRGFCLGGYAFYLGETTQVSYTWWNMTYKNHKRLSYLIVQQTYKNETIKNKPPFVLGMTLSKQSKLKPNEAFEIVTRVREPENEEMKFIYFASTDRDHTILEEFPNERISLEVMGKGSSVTAYAPKRPGIYRIYVVAIDPHGLAGTISSTISVR